MGHSLKYPKDEAMSSHARRVRTCFPFVIVGEACEYFATNNACVFFKCIYIYIIYMGAGHLYLHSQEPISKHHRKESTRATGLRLLKQDNAHTLRNAMLWIMSVTRAAVDDASKYEIRAKGKK
jgi:hypothetical protein